MKTSVLILCVAIIMASTSCVSTKSAHKSVINKNTTTVASAAVKNDSTLSSDNKEILPLYDYNYYAVYDSLRAVREQQEKYNNENWVEYTDNSANLNRFYGPINGSGYYSPMYYSSQPMPFFNFSFGLFGWGYYINYNLYYNYYLRNNLGYHYSNHNHGRRSVENNNHYRSMRSGRGNNSSSNQRIGYRPTNMNGHHNANNTRVNRSRSYQNFARNGRPASQQQIRTTPRSVPQQRGNSFGGGGNRGGSVQHSSGGGGNRGGRR